MKKNIIRVTLMMSILLLFQLGADAWGGSGSGGNTETESINKRFTVTNVKIYNSLDPILVFHDEMIKREMGEVNGWTLAKEKSNDQVLVVERKLANGRIKLKYKKPNKIKMDSLLVFPEIKDFEQYENDFLKKHGKNLPGLYKMKKIKMENRVRYTNNYEDVHFYETSGAIRYRRSLAKQAISIDKNKVINIAEDFINTYGGGLPKDAILDKIDMTRIYNQKTGKEEFYSYTLYYSRQYKGVTIGGPKADGIIIEIDAEGIAYYYRLWREYKENKKIKFEEGHLLDEEVVMEMNAEQLLKSIYLANGSLTFEVVNLIYKSSPYDSRENKVIPAWEFITDGNFKVYFNAITGEILY